MVAEGKKTRDLAIESILKKDTPTFTHNDDSVTSVNSITKLIIQALSSNNTRLFDTILDCTDAKIQENSCAQLPHPTALQFVSHLHSLITKDSKRIDHIIPWFKMTLMYHAQYFQDLPDKENLLSPIISNLQDLADSYQEMQKIAGKIEFYLEMKKRQDNISKEQEIFPTLQNDLIEELTRKPMIIVTEDDHGEVKMVSNYDANDEHDSYNDNSKFGMEMEENENEGEDDDYDQVSDHMNPSDTDEMDG